MNTWARMGIVGWMLGALLLGSALFSVVDHVVMLTDVVKRAPYAGPEREWPF